MVHDIYLMKIEVREIILFMINDLIKKSSAMDRSTGVDY